MKKQLLTKQKIKENIRQQIAEAESTLTKLKEAVRGKGAAVGPSFDPTPYLNNPNVRAMLDFLWHTEGEPGYDLITGTGGTFTDFTKHPAKVGSGSGPTASTAAGRYQITKQTYDDFAPKIGVTDFTPYSQDKLAVAIMKSEGALDDVVNGKFSSAISKLHGRWVNLPKGSDKPSKVKTQLANLNTIIANIAGASNAQAGELPPEKKAAQKKEKDRQNAEKTAAAQNGTVAAPKTSGPEAPSAALEPAKTAAVTRGMPTPAEEPEIVSLEPPSAAVDAAKAGSMAGGIVTPPDRSTPAPRPTAPTVAGPISWKDIYTLNKTTIGRDPNMIRPGQNLQLPDGTTYQVRPGDNLIKIASMVSGDDAIGRLIKSKQDQTIPESTNVELQDILRLAGKTR